VAGEFRQSAAITSVDDSITRLDDYVHNVMGDLESELHELRKRPERKISVFSVSTDDKQLIWLITSLSLLRYKNRRFQWSYFIAGNFSGESMDLIRAHQFTPVKLDQVDHFQNFGWPPECFWWSYMPQWFFVRGFTHSLYIDGDIIALREFHIQEVLEQFEQGAQMAASSVWWPDADDAGHENRGFNSGVL